MSPSQRTMTKVKQSKSVARLLGRLGPSDPFEVSWQKNLFEVSLNLNLNVSRNLVPRLM